jgi:hypothetical protein
LDAWRYLAVSSGGRDGYVVDTLAGSCTCKGYTYVGRCVHTVAAVILESRTTAQLALAA